MAELSDELLTLAIRIEGGEATAAEIAGVQAAIKGVGVQSEELKSGFAKPLEHIALRGFLADGIRAMGLGNEMRPLMTILSMSVAGVAGAFGLWIPILAAVGGLLFTLRNHLKEHSDGMEPVIQAHQKDTAALDEYAAAGGHLTAALAALREEIKESTKETVAKLLADNQAKQATEEAALASIRAAQAHMEERQATSDLAGGTALYTEAIKKHESNLKELAATIEANVHGYATWKEYVAAGTEEHKKAGEAAKKHADEEEKAASKVADAWRSGLEKVNAFYDAQDTKSKKAEAEAEANALAGAAAQAAAIDMVEAKTKEMAESDKELTLGLMDAKIASVDKWKEAQVAAAEESYRKQIRDAQKLGVDTEELERAHQVHMAQIHTTANTKKIAEARRLYGLEANVLQDYQNIALGVSKTVAAGFGRSVAGTIVDHKKLHDQLVALELDVKRQVIASLVEMGVKRTTQWAVDMMTSKKAMVSQVADMSALTAARATDAAAASAASATIIAANVAIGVSVKALTADYIALAIAEKAVLL